MKVLIVDDSTQAAANLERILYVEDNAFAAAFLDRIVRNYTCEHAQNIGRAWSLLEEDGPYNAILLDADLGTNTDLFFDDIPDAKEAIINGNKFSGYVFYQYVICEKFPALKDKTLFFTGYYNKFKESFENEDEFEMMKDRIFDKRESEFEKKIIDCINNIVLSK